MPDIACVPQPVGLATDIGAAYLEAEAATEQTGITTGFTFLTAMDTVAVDQDPDDRFTLLGNGGLQINRSGMCVIDYSFAIERTSAALVTDLFVMLLANTTPASYNGRLAPIGPAHAAVSGALPLAPGFQSFEVGIASWFNAGDVVRPQVEIVGPGTIRTIPNNDVIRLNGPSSWMSAVHLGPGCEPYQGSVWP